MVEWFPEQKKKILPNQNRINLRNFLLIIDSFLLLSFRALIAINIRHWWMVESKTKNVQKSAAWEVNQHPPPPRGLCK